MEYTIAKLARLSGVTTRTLRYYDQIGLLKPSRISNGYRIYGQKEVDLLQQILFYREMGLELKQIDQLIHDPAFDREKALAGQLSHLQQEKIRLETLIENVTRTIRSMKGETTMSDKEKFEGFKEALIKDNETKYGEEIRQKYGDETIGASNKKLKGMSVDKYKEAEDLRQELEAALKEAFLGADPASPLAQKVCEMHKRWICIFWPDGMYSKEAHKGLADMYVADERFRAHYEEIIPGCTEFLRDAIHIYLESR